MLTVRRVLASFSSFDVNDARCLVDIATRKNIANCDIIAMCDIIAICDIESNADRTHQHCSPAIPKALR